MKKKDMVAIGTIAMVACLLFCTPALANYNFDGFPVVTRDSGTVNGGVFVDYVPWASTTTLTGNFNVPTGNIAWARLYTGIWGGRPEYEGWVNVTFNGVDDTNGLGPIHLQGQNDANPNVWCSGSGKYWMYYDVADLVNAGAENTATTTKINATVGNFDGRVYGIVLVVVYEGGDNPKNIQYWINDGSDALNHVTAHNDGTTDFADFAGSVAGSVTEAGLTMVHLTAYDPACANCLQFNDAALDTSMVDSNNFELNSWDVASHVESSGNDAWYSRGDDGYVNVCNAILTLVSEELPDMVVEKSVEFNEDGKFIVSYTVTNIGGALAGESKTCKYVDSVLQESQICPALAPDERHSGAFAPEECPCDAVINVTVCADNDEVVDESNETNNCEVNFVECPPCKPDLVVGKGVEIGPDGKFIVSYTVTNIGGALSGESKTCKYVDSVLQESQICPALAPDESHSGAFAPEECPCGEMLNVTVCADNDEVVDESNETNNCEVNFVECPPCKPDLVVGKGVEIGPDGKFIVSYTVTNIGGALAGESKTCKYVDSVLQESQICPALAPDESHSGAFAPEECPCDAVINVTVCADNDKVVDESNETNNCEVNFVECPPCKPDLIVTDINAYHYNTNTPSWFNMLNEVDVTVKNNGSAAAGASSVCLDIDDDFFGKLHVPSLNPGFEHTVTFTSWKPIGADCLLPPCSFEWSYHDYNLKGVADCDGDVAESNETNNERTVVERACYNGYMADEPLENVAQDTIHGHIIFTTGDGSYGCLNSPGDTRATSYDITLPASAIVEHAQLNVYYTWVSPDHACPEMEVSITTATGTHVVPLEKAYNDIKCTCPGTMYVKSWGNYVFDIAPYVTGSGTYKVTVQNVGSSGHKFCLAAPGIVLVYADESAPLIDYWVNKGADVLLGGRRGDGGYLSLEECINDATFPASATIGLVETVTLGVVAPWGDSVADDVLYFNGVELGSGVYNGYSNPYSEEIDSITMSVGGGNAQVGVDVTDVTALYNEGSENVVGQGDDGDNMMPANAFLVVAYKEVCEPSIEVNKTVFDQETGEWVDEIEANICEIVRFRCEIHNNGTCCPLTDFVVTDILSESLEYADTATVNGEPWEPTIVNPKEFVWAFPEWVLEPCETITIEFDAHVITCGVDVNTQKVKAVCVETGEEVFDDDTATVVVPPKPGIEVNKTVWDQERQAWVEETTAEISELVRFRCEIHNNGTCCPLTDFVVTDILSESLEYADTATVNGEPWEPTIVNPKEFVWAFPEWVLEPCETITIEFDAHVITCGVDVNTQKVKAVCVKTGDQVFDRDTATVAVPPKPGIEVNKTVWDQEREAWVEETTAEISELVRFRCEIHNNGTCCPLTDFVVTDILSESLEYADTATVNGEPWEPTIVNPKEFVWAFPEWVLEPCETITIEFDAHVIDYGYDCNVQNATAICKETGVEVYDEDTACVDVPERPDLTVTEITVNYDASSLGGRAIGPEPGPDVHTECNNLSAVIAEENGVNVGSAFNVTFKVDGTTLCTVQVPCLTGGANKTVYCNCSWYPYAGDVFAITVTVDSNHEIPESNETNNTKWNNGTVVSNGYKGDGWQGPDKNLINEQCHEQDTINLTYSVGDSEYVSGYTYWTDYTANWTTDDLPVPDGANIEKAMLYVYYTWDKNDVMPDNVTMVFNGNNIALARHYSDSKGFGSSNYPSGMLVYNVLNNFAATGTNNAILTKAAAADVVSMRGMLLMVVYKHPDEPERMICIDEGYDMLYAKDSYAITSEEATTYAPFTCCEPVPVEGIGKATVIAVAPSASDGDDMNRLSFNDGLWQGAWSCFAGATQLGIAEADVLAYLKPADNRANFQSHIPAGGDKGDFMDASNAFLILEKKAVAKSDLTVTEITVNYDASSLGGRAIGPEPGPGVHTECNNLSAVIEEENGVNVGSAFNVTFKVDGTTLCTVQVPGLTGGANKTVYCNCSWYPYAGDDFAINVTVDSNHEIPESNETNNTKWNNGTVVSNGYKGDGWQGPDKNLINVQCHEQDTINLTYSVGDSEYVSGYTYWTDYTANWTTTDLPVPDGANIEKAMLYVYYTWDKNDVMPDNVTMEFNGNNIALARHYSDSKGFGSSNYPSGMLVYNVLNNFTATGTNNAVLTKTAAADVVSMRGMLLMVVYKHQDEPERIICIDEGYDMLYAKDSYAITSEEATTYAPFTCCEPVPVEELVKATLIAVAPSAKDGDDMNRLSFNGGLWKGIWDHYEANTQLGIAEANVLAYLKPAENRANFQSHIPAGGDKGDFMDASNAFLILEKKGEIPCPAKYAVYQANVRDPEGRLNELRALRDKKLEDRYVTRYYEYSPMLTLVLSRAGSDLVKDGAQLVSRYSIPVGLHVQGMDVNERITKQDVEEALSFTDRLKREVMKNSDAIGAKSTEAIIVFIDEFEGQVKASEGKTFSAALKSSIYYESGQLRVDQEIVKE